MAGGWSCGGSTGVSLCGVSCGWLGLGCPLGVLSVLGGLAALLGATKFWQDTPFLMNLLNWPDVEEGIQTLIESFMQYPANSVLIEGFHILMSSTQMPLAILASVQPPYFRSAPKVQFNHRFLFGHNTQALAMCDIVREEFIRPSSCDPADKSWLPPSSFYCRAVVPNHDDFHRK
jgi:hypothetical protein